MICLTLSGPTIEDNLLDLEANKDFVDICELRLDLLDPEEQAKARHNLLKYCELDTYAMVKVWQELERVAK